MVCFIEKDPELMLAKIEGRRRRACQKMKWLDSIINSVGMCVCKLQEIVKDRKPGVLQSMELQGVRQD